MFGMLCEVCGEATARYERRSGLLECDRCHSDIEAGRKHDPLRKVPVKLSAKRSGQRVA
jgi:hypothetical protein